MSSRLGSPRGRKAISGEEDPSKAIVVDSEAPNRRNGGAYDQPRPWRGGAAGLQLRGRGQHVSQARGLGRRLASQGDDRRGARLGVVWPLRGRRSGRAGPDPAARFARRGFEWVAEHGAGGLYGVSVDPGAVPAASVGGWFRPRSSRRVRESGNAGEEVSADVEQVVRWP